MPIRVLFEMDGNELPLAIIEPGLPGSLRFEEQDEPQILVVSCNPDESGGFLYKSNPATAELTHGEEYTIIDSNEAEIEAVLERNGSYQREVMVPDGLGTLMIQHFTSE